MNPKGASSPMFHGPDLEAQTSSGGGAGSHASSFRTSDSHKRTSPRTPIEYKEEHSHSLPRGPSVAQDEKSPEGTEAPNNTESGWKPWGPGEPYRTKIPENQTTMEDWVKAMDASDDGMCKGWRDQIDALIIFAGLFSATVTAFTIESYQWLDETPADTLARLQLRALLVATDDPAIDRLAPASFNVSLSSVLINVLWFASLTIALAAVVISILCKQWLYEYQRYDNFTTKESFLIHGLRYRGLHAWRVPAIIAFLPILLQTALMLFLIGVLILLWLLQTVVASIITAIVGFTYLFLGVTTILPAIQYIYPAFDTQCAYKSSQSWSFLLISTFWLFNFSMFTSWATFDRWEVTCVYNGTGHTLSRVYELLSNSIDAFQSIYSFLADTSLKPTINADFTLLSDFIDGLEASRRDGIVEAISQTANPDEDSKRFYRLEQLKGCVDNYYKIGRRFKLRPTFRHYRDSYSSFHPSPGLRNTSYAYHLRIQNTFIQFLYNDVHLYNPAVFNRYAEHWARCIMDARDDLTEEEQWKINANMWQDIFVPVYNARMAHIPWDPDVGSHLVEFQSHLFKTDQFVDDAVDFLSDAYPSFVESHDQHNFNPPPAILLKDIQEWISRMPELDLPPKVQRAEYVLLHLVHKGIFSVETPRSSSHTSDLQKQYQRSFAQFLVDFFEREDVLNEHRKSVWTAETDGRLAVLRNHLDQNSSISL